jgi:hypothetical protein
MFKYEGGGPAPGQLEGGGGRGGTGVAHQLLYVSPNLPTTTRPSDGARRRAAVGPRSGGDCTTRRRLDRAAVAVGPRGGGDCTAQRRLLDRA